MNDDSANIIYLGILLALVGSSVIARAAHDWGKAGKHLAIWLAIFIVAAMSAVYWEDFTNSKFAAALVPGKPQIGQKGELIFIRGQDKHFHITANIDGQPIKFLVDTGASDIVLARHDAENLGYDFSRLKFNKIYSTANGQTRGASVTLDEFEVGNLKLTNLPASVNEGEMESSLLGMVFLSKLKSYRFEGTRLILQP